MKPPPELMTIQPRAYGYVRLSRPDLKGPGSTEEKLAVRASICRRIAKEHGLDLADEDIIAEQESGSKLSNRPGALQLLQLAREGKLKNLVTPYQDRLFRGDKADEQLIEDTLVLAKVTLYHTEGAPTKFDDDYDPLLFEVKALVARQELRNYTRRVQQTNLSLLEQGRWFRGKAPYGYRYLFATFDPYGNPLTSAGYEPDPETWPILCEVWRRVKTEPQNRIVRDFNKREIPAPRGGKWNQGTIRAIIDNPLYAGYQTQRSKVSRGKAITLKKDEYIWAKVQGQWETCITLEEWWEVQRLSSGRRAWGREPSGALTNVLVNWCGEPMAIGCTECYTCRCRILTTRHGGSGGKAGSGEGSSCHAGTTISQGKIEGWARDAIGTIVHALTLIDPATLTPKTPRPSRRSLATDISRLRREIQEKSQSAEDMMARASYYIGLFGQQTYEESAARVRTALDAAKAEMKRLEEESAAPDVAEILPLFLRLRGKPIDEVWDRLTTMERRALVEGVFSRIQVQHDGQRRHNFCGVTPTLWNWVEDLLRAADVEFRPLLKEPKKRIPL